MITVVVRGLRVLIAACFVAAAAATETGLVPHAQCCSVAFENSETRFSAFLAAPAGTVFLGGARAPFPGPVPDARHAVGTAGTGSGGRAGEAPRDRRSSGSGRAGRRGYTARPVIVRILLLIPRRREKRTTRSCGSAATGSGSIIVGKTETADACAQFRPRGINRRRRRVPVTVS